MYNSYENMIDMKRPVSPVHQPMSRYKRAAQFAPFAALTGYDEAIAESTRYTERKIDSAEDLKYILDCKLKYLAFNIASSPEVRLTFFVPDGIKEGGRYETLTGKISVIDTAKKIIIMSNSSKINIADVISIDSDIFPDNIRLI